MVVQGLRESKKFWSFVAWWGQSQLRVWLMASCGVDFGLADAGYTLTYLDTYSIEYVGTHKEAKH